MRALLGLIVALAVAPGAAAADVPCAAADGRVPVVVPGQEREVRALFAPHVAGEPIEGAGGWVFRSVFIDRSTLAAKVESPDGAAAWDLVLRPATCRPGDPANTPSFALDPPPADAPEAARAAMARLEAAVRAHDDGRFWKAWHRPEPGGRAAGGGAAAGPGDAAPTPLHRSLATVALALLLAALALLLDLPAAARDAGLLGGRAPAAGPPGRGDARASLRVAAALLALTAAAWAVRVLADPTFIREAYPYPSPYWLAEPPELAGPVTAYPRGPDLVVAVLAPLLPADPYAAWFAAHVLLGALAVPFAFSAGVSLTGSRAGGLVAAAVLAFWPQHVRVSASEATHAQLMTWGLAAFAAALRAAATGRLTPFLAAVGAATAAVLMRPEGALLLPGLALVALGHGPGVRRRLRSPGRLAAVAVAIALLLPTVATILGDESTAKFTPGAGDTERLGPGSLLQLLLVLVSPDGRNALFDAQITPVWLWPLAWWGAAAGWRRGHRAAVAGLALTALLYLLLYVGMPPAVTIWKLARYHASLLPAVALLAALGLWDLLGRLPALAARPARRAAAGLAVAAAGLALWWPAMAALPMDWQQGLEATLDVGRATPELASDTARLVLPDNRRRFLDLQPRAEVTPLTRGRQDIENAITVEHALRSLHADGDDTPAWFWAGLYCGLALGPGETWNPQCAAMEAAFVLEPVAERVADGPPYLADYAETRVPGPIPLTLYRVGRRKLPPEEALKLLPAPIPPDAPPIPGYPMGAPTPATMEPPEPPLGELLAPHLHPAPWAGVPRRGAGPEP